MPAATKDHPENQSLPRFEKIGIIARWQPVHTGHAVLLSALCDRADHVMIGVGSSNVYNFRNPFTLEETLDMLHLTLTGRQNYTLISVPDLNNGPKWREMVLEMFGELALFLTANPYVYSLMKDVYPIQKPVTLVPDEDKIPLTGMMVRREMARGGKWQDLVPANVAAYIEKHKIEDRFKQEFGLQTLAIDSIIQERSDS
ncbi:MAG TPA: hypothetical protein VJ965_11510 [Anaerolineales bacterium]|nr:hypothetical protein [Anaerolineales bacterium]